MAARVDIISIGTLSRNLLWKEAQPVRSAHATCSLVRSGKKNILVDPSLPPAAIGARLFERVGMRPEQIDTIFLTNFRPAHRAGLALFTSAKVYIHEGEQLAMHAHLTRLIEDAPDEDVDRKLLKQELQLLNTFHIAPDKLADQVDLFPLPGYTPGTCGLLIPTATTTTLIAGDAVPTLDHYLAGQVLPDTFDIAAAHDALREVYEIAEIVVPGHDNLFLNPRAQGM